MNLGLERTFDNNDKLTLVYCVVFLIITFLRLKYFRVILVLLRSLYSNKYFLEYSNEFQDMFNAIKISLFIVQNLIFSIFFYLVAGFLGFDMNGDSDLFFLKTFGSITLFLSGHYLLLLMLAKIFDFSEHFRQIHVLKVNYLKLVTLVLLPVLLFFTYVDIENTKFSSTFLICFFAILLMLRAVLLLVKNNKFIIESLFYFIVYLCTLEIAPVLLIYKVVVNK
ncbi:DUF4271 domain-containing protein [Flavicella sp.]|uniref:DUF4271 domain-containing protein n=1 Tax=Flavicella sp. TaxID=2957742 RepID=UPI003015E2F6